MANILGLDIGDARIGVAIADAKTPFPAPLTTLEASEHLASEFASLLRTNAVQTVVIGYPRNQAGEATEQTKRVEHIAKLLKIPKHITVVWQDESVTSVKAEEELKRRKKPYQKGDIDALAATYILEDYIRANPVNAHQAVSGVAAHHAPATQMKKTHKRSKGKRHYGLWIAAALLGLITAALITMSVWYFSALQPLTSSDQYRVVTVQQGDATADIATKLQNEKIIKNAQAFTLYVRLNGVNNLQAGSYRLSSAQSVSEIVSIIAGGRVTTVNVLIAPGLRLSQIKAVMIKEGFSEDEIDQALIEVRDHPLLKNYSDSAPLEGYIYPNTYQIEPNTSATQFLRTVLDTFDKAITPEIRAGLARQGLTLDQAINLASIVQKEVSEPKVQRTVAQVFIKRLNEGMVLGSDVTYMYAASEFGTVNNPSSSSPYNTRRFQGLPPSPIANFNLSALQAVANPTDTDYTYFVAGDDGTTYFSNTLEQHEAYVRRYCIKGCQ